uniref:FAD_binding_2 domain-containing protein n=1 Tax=Brugia pahangi TaxID=6280 RepID=A0A0N4T448_BRUPA
LNNSGTTANIRQLQLPEFTDPVIIVGGGLAGLSATLEGKHDAANVVLVEGEKDLGGNSQKASSGIAACNMEAQCVRQIHDSSELFYSDTMSAGDRENDHILVDQLVPQPKEGKPVAVDVSIIKTLRKNFTCMKNYKYRILTDEASTIATANFPLTFISKIILRVKICDYSKEDSVLQEFDPEKADFPTTNNSPWAIGRGIKMARTMDAVLVDMHNVQHLWIRKIQQQRRNFLPLCAKNEKAGAHTAFMVMDDQVVEGLLATREITGGVHGRNRLAGNSWFECVAYGRIAGRNAANIHYSASDATLTRADL